MTTLPSTETAGPNRTVDCFLLAAVVAAIIWAAYETAHARGYSAGTFDTSNRWSTITDRCIAKLESTLVIARNR